MLSKYTYATHISLSLYNCSLQVGMRSNWTSAGNIVLVICRLMMILIFISESRAISDCTKDCMPTCMDVQGATTKACQTGCRQFCQQIGRKPSVFIYFHIYKKTANSYICSFLIIYGFTFYLFCKFISFI